MTYFDIHTHKLNLIPNETAVLNLFWHEQQSLPLNQPFSLSVHPWYLEQYSPENFEKELARIEKNPFLWAIGECGLDKNTSFTSDYQISVLNEQYKLAERLKKPMIIHCVQSFELLLNWKKDKNSVQILIHGFVKKMHLLESLLKAGFYVSFGAALCQDRPTVKASFLAMPMDRLFLETDNQSEYNISDIYLAAAAIKKITVSELEDQIRININNFFHFNQNPNGNACY